MLRAWLAVHRGLAVLSVHRFGRRYAAALLWYADRPPFLKGPPPAVRLRYCAKAVAVYRTCGSNTQLAHALAVLTQHRLRTGQPAEALVCAREGVDLNGLDAHARHALALALHALDRPDEALVAAQAAVALYRDRVEDDPKRINQFLAHALDTNARCLAGLGRHEEALAAFSEAVELFDRAPFHRQMRRFLQIWSTQVALACQLPVAGRYEEALRVGQDALDSWLGLLAVLSPRHGLSLRAPLLQTLAACHAALGRHEVALTAAERAVADFRRLGTMGNSNPAELARALDCLADQQHRLGRSRDAVTSLREAVTIRTGLAATDPRAHQAALAATWATLSIHLWNLGERAEAIDANRASADAYRRVAGPEPALAGVFCMLSARLRILARPAEAVTAGREAVAAGRRIAGEEPLLGECLSVLSEALSAARRPEEALTVAEEATTSYRRLALRDLSYEPDLARSLRDLAQRLAAVDRDEEAIEVEREAAGICRLLAAVDLRQRADLCGSLHDLALLLSRANRHGEAVDVMTESIDARRVLAGHDPAGHEANLGRALRQRALDLAALCRSAEALPDIDAAVELYRRLVVADPQEHLLELAYSLRQAARQRAEAGHTAEAVERLRELRDLARRYDSLELDRIAVTAFQQAHREAPDEIAEAWRRLTGTAYPVIC